MLYTNRPSFPVWIVFASVACLESANNTAADEAISALIDQAKANYQPVTSEEVEAAQDELSAAALELEQFLIPGSGRGERWKKYLDWQSVQDSLAEGAEPNLVGLRTTLDKLRSGTPGTELPPFRHAAAAIQKFVDFATVARARDQRAFVDRQLDLLKKYVDRYEFDHSPRARFEIERRIDFFTGIDRATELTTALRDRFDQPNVHAEVSEHFLSRVASESIDRVGPVKDCILGTSIRGTGHTTGSVAIETLSSPSRAAVLIHLAGITLSETCGYNDPVVIRSSGTTPFTATKRIELEDANFWNYPTRVSAKTSTITRSVQKQGGGFGSKIIAKIGEKKVTEKKPQANYIASRHAEERIAEKLEKDLLPKLQDARYEYEHQFKKPLAMRDAEPQSIVFSSTDHSLSLDLLQAVRGELGADTPPTAFPEGYDVALRVHETGAANFASALLAGARLSKKTKDSDPKLDVELPKSLRDAIHEAREDAVADSAAAEEIQFKPWSIRFRRQRPLSFRFFDNLVMIRLHAARITAGDDTYDGWDIVVKYGLHVQNGGLMLVRDGEIEVIPTAFDPADGGGLTNRQVGLRGNLAKELNRQAEAGRGFAEEFEIPMIDLPEKIADRGPLMLQDATSQDGWLSLGWMLPQ